MPRIHIGKMLSRVVGCTPTRRLTIVQRRISCEMLTIFVTSAFIDSPRICGVPIGLYDKSITRLA